MWGVGTKEGTGRGREGREGEGRGAADGIRLGRGAKSTAERVARKLPRNAY